MLASDSIQKNYLYILFVLSLAAECIVLVLFILLNVLGFIGFDGGNPITATCSANYYITKYSQINLAIRTAYIWTILSFVAFSGVVVILVQCILRARNSQQTNIFISACNKIALYLLASVALLASIPAFGYYFNFLVQLGNCTYTYDSTYVNLIFAFATIAFALLLAVLILLFVFYAVRSDEKYRQVENNSTEPQEKVDKVENLQHYKRPIDQPYKKNPQTYERTPQEPQRNSPPRRVPNRGEELEHTKQNLYNSPSRQPATNIYSKQVDPQPLIRPIPIPQRRLQPTPLLEPRTYKKQVFQPENSRKAPSSNEGKLIFSKSKYQGTPDDQQDFAKQQNRFMSKYGARPILPSSGVQEVNREKRYNKDYFHDDLQRKAQQKSPSPKKGRQGNLLNYIRGKYGN